MIDKFKKLIRGDTENYILFPKISLKLFAVVLALGYGIHSFRITQMINTADDVSVLMKGYGGGTTFGRWGLDFLGFRVNYKWIIGSFNLPAFDGIMTLIFLSLSACIILELFNLRNSRLGILFAVIFVAYPVCSATLLYMFTAAYYGLSCFLAVLAAWCLKIGKKLYGCLAIICIALSLGLYQAYFPLTATLCLFLVLDYFLSQHSDIKSGLQMGLYYVLMMCMGLGLYFVILNNRLKNLGAELTDYQNLNSMGQIQIQEIPRLLMRCYKVFLQFSSEIYHSINTLSIIRKGILVLFVLCVVLGLWGICQQKKLSNRIMIVLLMALTPIAVNLIEIMCSRSDIYVLMVYSTVFIYFLPLILIKRIQVGNGISGFVLKFFSLLLGAFFIVLILGYSWHANWNYVALEYMNRETESYMTTLVTRIKSVENYRDEYSVLFVGERSFSDQQFVNPYSAYHEYYFNEHQQNYLINAFSWKDALSAYTGFTFTSPPEQKCEEIYALQQFQEMNCYPDDGSISVIDEVIVVKIAE